MLRVGLHGIGMVSALEGGKPSAAAVANPWWDPTGAGLCIWAAYQPKGAANLAASYLDLSGLGNNCGPGVAPAWDAVNGWKFNGATHYLDTGFTPQNDQSQCMIIKFTNLTTVTGVLAGMRSGANRLFQLRYNALLQHGGCNGQCWAGAPDASLALTMAVSGSETYYDGAPDGAALGAWGGASGDTVWIGGQNNVGVLANPCAEYVQAFVIYDCALTAPQVLAIHNAMVAI